MKTFIVLMKARLVFEKPLPSFLLIMPGIKTFSHPYNTQIIAAFSSYSIKAGFQSGYN
jgi:hypothetical protein